MSKISLPSGRSISQYAGVMPEAILDGSRAQARFYVGDSKNDILYMHRMLEAAPKTPQDMDLRELFDHVALVADAVRAALLTHPGMTPPKSEGT